MFAIATLVARKFIPRTPKAGAHADDKAFPFAPARPRPLKKASDSVSVLDLHARPAASLPLGAGANVSLLGLTTPEVLHQQLHGTVADAPYTVNMAHLLRSIEVGLERDMGVWGTRGGRNGAVIGVILGGVLGIACMALPVIHVSVPLLGVILSFTLLGVGFALGFAAQAIIRHRWQARHPEAAANYTTLLHNAEQAIHIESERNKSYDPTKDLRELSTLQATVAGGFYSNLYQVVAAVTGLDIKLVMAIRRRRLAARAAVPAMPALAATVPAGKPEPARSKRWSSPFARAAREPAANAPA